MFTRTFRSLETEADGRSVLVPLLVGALLAAWGYWLVAVPVSVYETSTTARLAVAKASLPIETAVEGRVIAVHGLELGRVVANGEVLVELDSEEQRLALAAATARETGLVPELEAIRVQRDLETVGLDAEERRGNFAGEEMQSRHHEALVAARHARLEAERTRKLAEIGASSDADYQLRVAEAEQREAAAQSIAAQKRKSGSESLSSASDRRTRVAAMDRELARLRAELAVERAHIDELRHDIERHRLRASGDGKLAEIGTVVVGSVLKPGDRIASVLASDALRVVAELPPAAVFGRVHEGQSARVQFAGFPWLEYGQARAHVHQVASEVRDGSARVDLLLDADTARGIPLQHGLPATVTIEVERATAARLILRAVGKVHEPAAIAEAERR